MKRTVTEDYMKVLKVLSNSGMVFYENALITWKKYYKQFKFSSSTETVSEYIRIIADSTVFINVIGIREKEYSRCWLEELDKCFI